MDAIQILSLYDREMRIDPPGGLMEIYRRPGLTFCATTQPSPHGGWVIYTDLDAADVDRRIREVSDFFAARGSNFEWKVYDHDRPADLKPRLKAHGFVDYDLEALLALDVEHAPSQLLAPPGEQIRRVNGPADLERVAQVQEHVWAEPFADLVEMLSGELQADPQGISVFLAEVDGYPASCAWIRYYAGRQFAELYGGATLRAYRGRGLYTALVAARLQEARRRGVRFLAVDTSPMSRPILEKRGFVFLTHSQPFVKE